MGGWNGTCNISKLPIFHGDDIVVIPLVAVSDDLSTSTCYPTDNFVPFAMPIFGKYNDYGGIEDSIITPENDVLIRSYEFYEKESRNAEPHKIEIGDSVEKFISENMCYSALFVKMKSFIYSENLARVSFFVVHKGLYQLLIDEIGNRVPANQTQTYRDILKDSFAKATKQYKETITSKECLDAPIVKDFALKNFAKHVFTWRESLSPCVTHWQILAQKYLEAQNESIIDAAIDKGLLIHAISLLRIGFFCDSGVGSQSNETRMHYIVAQFTLSRIRSYANQVYKDSGECESIDGVREPLYFFE